MIWLDENPHLINIHTESTLSTKFFAFDPILETQRLNIICQNKIIASSLINAFEMFHDKFQDLNLRIGWFKDEDHNLTEVFEDETIFIGHKAYCSSFENVFGPNSCKITKTSRDKNIHAAFQRHFNENTNPRSLSLGEIRTNIQHVDPLLRAADGIFYYLDAIQKRESSIKESFVSGLNIDEACQIARFAGMSLTNKLIYFNIGEDHLTESSAEILSLLIWYYLEGSINKNIERIDHVNNYTFMVNNPYFDLPIKFVKTNITGRWWYQHPEDKYYVPCTEEDYIAASEGSIPDSFTLSNQSI